MLCARAIIFKAIGIDVRYALITDIHGNLEALDKVIQRIETEHCDKILCLGDVVGYGPFPNECLVRVKERVDGVIVGNHDAAAIAMTDTLDFNENAEKAIIWTRRQLSSASQDYLSHFLVSITENDAMFIHASPHNPTQWNYILTDKDIQEAFSALNQKICFFGHTHYPIGYRLDSNLSNFTFLYGNEIVFEKGARYLVNVGSVGQPRDGNPLAAFGIYDSDNGRYHHVRVEYDVQKTQIAMEKFHLPRFLIQRLQWGQ
jgi:predicted phosphodiesterase